jgi:O-antigen/teichoic acid export membrane protein
MRREFLINILFLIFINLLIKPFFIFGIDLAVQNRVGAAYGTYFALLNFTYIFQILNDFGIQNYNNRHISRHPHLLPKYFPNLLALKFLLSGLYIAVTLAIGWAVVGYDVASMPLLLTLLANQALVQLILFLRSNISGLGHFRLDSLLSALDKLLMLIFCGMLLWGNLVPGPVTVLQFALAQTLSLACTVVIVYAVLTSRVPLTVWPSRLKNPAMGRAALLVMLKQSFPFALVVLLMSSYTRLDGILLERILPDGQVHAEIYAGAYRLLDAANMLGYLFATLLLPMFARLLRQSEPVRPLTSVSFQMIWAGSICLAACVFFARRELVELMMPLRATAYRWDTLGILIWTFVPVGTTYIFSTLLTADGRLMQMNRFFIAGILLDILLNLALVPRFQAIGSAWATLGTQSFVALSMIGLCLRYYDVRPSWRGVSRIGAYTILSLAAGWLLFQHSSFTWWFKVIALGLACGILALMTGLIKTGFLSPPQPPTP